MKKIRDAIDAFVHNKIFEAVILFLIFACIMIYCLQSFFPIAASYQELLENIQISITIIFLMEFILRMLVKPFYTDWWIDLLAVSDIITPAVKAFKMLRALRFVRLVRTIRIIKFFRQKDYSPKVRIYNYIASFILLIIMLFQIVLFRMVNAELSQEQLKIMEGMFFLSSFILIALVLVILKINLDKGFDKPLAEFLISQVALLELKDKYTAGHSLNVAYYATQIGMALGMDNYHLRNLYLAGMVHDIGKVGVRDGVLNKRSSLDEGERQHIMQHPSFADKSLRPLKSLLPESVYRSVVEHHEWLDGSGYPKGLKERRIHEFSKIISVADTLDAMLSDRPYRKGVSPAEAFKLLEQAKSSPSATLGRQLDSKFYQIAKILIKRGLGEGIGICGLSEKIWHNIEKKDLKIFLDKDRREKPNGYPDFMEIDLNEA